MVSFSVFPLNPFEAPGDPTSYLVIDYDVTKALPYLKKLNEQQSEFKITLTHLMSKAIAVGMSKMRRDIGRIRWGYVRFYNTHLYYSSKDLTSSVYLFWLMSKEEKILFLSLFGRLRMTQYLTSLKRCRM